MTFFSCSAADVAVVFNRKGSWQTSQLVFLSKKEQTRLVYLWVCASYIIGRLARVIEQQSEIFLTQFTFWFATLVMCYFLKPAVTLYSKFQWASQLTEICLQSASLLSSSEDVEGKSSLISSEIWHPPSCVSCPCNAPGCRQTPTPAWVSVEGPVHISLMNVRSIHDKVKSYKCQECLYTSADKANLNRHVKNAHEKKSITPKM